MKAITIHQPWAHLIVTPGDELPDNYMQKLVENRRWTTTYRGPIAIHAGMSDAWMSPQDWRLFPRLPKGCVVGIADLVECIGVRQIRKQVDQGDDRWQWVLEHQWMEGPFCWVLLNARRLVEPYQVRGQQGLWDVEIPSRLVP